jgi:AcrR family transcriptional regulator
VVSVLLDGMAAEGEAWPARAGTVIVRDGDPDATPASELFLKAATQLINDEGYHGASVERISARLNVSKGAFYHHNETKDELVEACFQRTFDIMWRAIREAEAAGGSGLQVLVTIAHALVAHQLEGDAPLLRTSALTTVPEAIHDRVLEKIHRISLRFSSIVSDGIADGSIRPVDTAIAAQMITGAVNAVAELHFWAPGVTAETVGEHVIAPLFAGLRTR